MKSLSGFSWLVILLPAFANSQIGSKEQGIHFETGLSWTQIKLKAKNENKYVFLDAFASWCVPCKMMDKQVYLNDTLGAYMNEKFISVRVQMDTSKKDDDYMKSWYADAHTINEKYHLPGYPSFLFFAPDGRLVYKDIGYKNVADFFKVAGKAIDPQNVLYYSRLEDYNKGKRDYGEMRELSIRAEAFGDGGLARLIAKDYTNHINREQLLSIDNIYFVRDVAGDKELAKSLAIEYKKKYLDKLSEEELCTKEMIQFMARYLELVSTRDNFFRLCYEKPDKVARVFGDPGLGRRMAMFIITREEMEVKLLFNKKPFFKNPKWRSIEAIISQKYPRENAKHIVLDFQIRYYRNFDLNWRLWAEYKDEKFREFPPSPTGLNIYIFLNVDGAWDVFLHCNDHKVLMKGLHWIDQAIQFDVENKAAYYDTKANLLYKLGRVDQAISIEQEAIKADDDNAKKDGKQRGEFADSFNEVIMKMKKLEPTYKEEGAIWDANTLPKGIKLNVQ